MKTAVGGDISNTVVGGGANVTNSKDDSNHRNIIGSDSIRYFQIGEQAVSVLINNDIENSKLFSDSELNFRVGVFAIIID